ncbi:class I SAM-dependent methyltransferase [Actinomadura sp. ATCC 31491]|uniref:Class I SAM-dependent methyltransferase n=1 Tax=Actinomadura luzonensis TaxID=2805427 RepID=A0ABT0FQI6_9ACTN|nr:class I SAM-dependent methyltransferase [Actinomadura luzonensis]MCK2214544.1 class I SAM-dependent methyltransferase [Actinomadura luzonensis]
MAEPSPYLTATADAYDALAEIYADFARNSLDRLPLDRAIIAAFAELVRAGGPRPVAEAGCGPGYLTAHLRDLGLDAFGVDLSPALIDIARRDFPGVRFEVGSMGAFDMPDGELGGVVSWYSVIHTPPAELPPYLAEFRRVLAPGGHLLAGFFEAEDGPVAPFDHKVTTAYRWPIDELAALAREAGFAEVARMSREPLEDERFRRGHLLMRAIQPDPAATG